ncbi:hypothetical protein FRC03_007554 [Tulasnella sp. 419]|nr:hypothetical protein FRC03_007554 [Tulasnella sp. 419]
MINRARLHHALTPTSFLNIRSLHIDPLQHSLRNLLRQTAQPVVVVTSILSKDGPEGIKYHGATLSSFASISMHPSPLVTFSLRIPSRMATSIHDSGKAQEPSPEQPNVMVNLLSASQASHAIRFSRADLYPNPFEGIDWTLSKDGLPVLNGSLGALSCRVIASSPLDALTDESSSTELVVGPTAALKSELYIAKVLGVEEIKYIGEGNEDTLPLVYHHRRYCTVGQFVDDYSSSMPPPASRGTP